MEGNVLIERWLRDSTLKLFAEKLRVNIQTSISLHPIEAQTLTENGLGDLRGLDLSNLNIKNTLFKNVDLSFSNFSNSRIENCKFEDIMCLKVDFSEVTETHNYFKGVSFEKCKFDSAALGYQGTVYSNCYFVKSSFKKVIFIRPEFDSSLFDGCHLNGADFYASSFDNCTFIGALKNVWFRGEYPYKSDVSTFGRARVNSMNNCSFASARLENVNFTNNCSLSTIKLPEIGNYTLFNKWNTRIDQLKKHIDYLPKQQQKHFQLFVTTYGPGATGQEWFLINHDDVRRIYGTDEAESILQELHNLKF